MKTALDKALALLTVAELIEVLKYHFQPNTESTKPVKDLMSTKKVQVKGLSEIYGWGESTIYGWCKNRVIPHSVIGREKWFDLDEIDTWIASNKVRTNSEVLLDFEKGKKFYPRKIK